MLLDDIKKTIKLIENNIKTDSRFDKKYLQMSKIIFNKQKIINKQKFIPYPVPIFDNKLLKALQEENKRLNKMNKS